MIGVAIAVGASVALLISFLFVLFIGFTDYNTVDFFKKVFKKRADLVEQIKKLEYANSGFRREEDFYRQDKKQYGRDQYSSGFEQGMEMATRDKFGEHYDRFLKEIDEILRHEKMQQYTFQKIEKLKKTYGKLEELTDNGEEKFE